MIHEKNIINFQVDELVPYTRNARTHSKKQITKVARSIDKFGFINPVIIDAQNMIVAGHARVLAAIKLGLDYVPTILVKHLSEAQKRAYIIADNCTSSKPFEPRVA